MNKIEIIISELKNVPEHFSVDGIIKLFEEILIKFGFITKIAVYFQKITKDEDIKMCQLTTSLWYSSKGFRRPHDYLDLSIKTITDKNICKKDVYTCYPLIARSKSFGTIVIDNKNDTKEFRMLVDYLSILLYSEKLSFLANKDRLTGLYNRGYILSVLEKWEESSRNYSIILIDLDKFKHYNDRYGHITGDHILKLASKEMKSVMSGINIKNVLARYGGEEFIIAIDTTSKDELKSVMERVRISIFEKDFSTKEYSLKITASLGGAIKTDSHNSLDSFIDSADTALYEAKDKGRNRSIIK